MTPTNTSDYLTCREAADILNLSPETVKKFCQKGRLGQKLGDRWVIALDDLRQFERIPRPRRRPPKNNKESEN